MMTLAQKGAYMQLLCHDWLNDGIPDNDDQLAALSGAGPEWCKGGYTLVKACFQPHLQKEGHLTSPRLQKEREKQAEWRAKSAEGGRKSAAMRWGKGSLKSDKGGYKMVVTKRQPKGNSSSSSSSSYSTPLTPQDDNRREDSTGASGGLDSKTIWKIKTLIDAKTSKLKALRGQLDNVVSRERSWDAKKARIEVGRLKSEIKNLTGKLADTNIE